MPQATDEVRYPRFIKLSPDVGDVLVQNEDEEKQFKADFAANEKKRLADLAKQAKADAS